MPVCLWLAGVCWPFLSAKVIVEAWINMGQLILLFSLMGMLAACQRAPSDVLPKETTLRVNHYRQSCQGEGTFSCLLVQADKQLETDEWELFYDEIEGFHHEEGYVYTLKVRIVKISNPPMDGSDRRYILLKVLSKQKAQ
jgi:hypothetical protein